MHLTASDSHRTLLWFDDPRGAAVNWMHTNDHVLVGCPGAISGLAPITRLRAAVALDSTLRFPGHTGEFDLGAHPHYYDVGNESLHKIVAVAAGRGDQLESQRMTLPLRQGVGFDAGSLPIPDAPHSCETEIDRAARTGLEYDSSTPGKRY